MVGKLASILGQNTAETLRFYYSPLLQPAFFHALS